MSPPAVSSHQPSVNATQADAEQSPGAGAAAAAPAAPDAAGQEKQRVKSRRQRSGKKHKKILKELQESTIEKPIISANSNCEKGASVASLKKTLGQQPKTISVSPTVEDLEAIRLKILDCGAAADAARACSLCEVICITQEAFDTHIAGRKHETMVKKQQQASVARQDNNLGEQPKENAAPPTEEGLEARRRKILDHGVAEDAVKVCSLCNIICLSQRMFDIHIAGRKHAAKVKQQQLQQASVGSQDKALGEQTMEKTAPPTEEGLDAKRDEALDHGVATTRVNVCSLCKVICISQTMFDIHMVGRKHAAMVKQQQQQQVASVSCQDKPLGEQPKEKSAAPTQDGLEAKRQKVLDHGVAADAVKVCSLCKVICNSQIMFDIHMAGRKHAAMVKQPQQKQASVGCKDKALVELPKSKSIPPTEEGLVAKRRKVLDGGVTADAAMVKQQQQQLASLGCQDEPLGEQPKEQSAIPTEDGLEAKRRKVLDNGVAADVAKVCYLCKVICNSQMMFDIHMAGRKHAAMFKQQQQQAAIGCQDKALRELPKEKSIPPTVECLVTKRQKVLDGGVDADAVKMCSLCKVLDGGVDADAVKVCSLCKLVFISQTMFDTHMAGQKHAAMSKQQQQQQASLGGQVKLLGEQPKEKSSHPTEEGLQAKRWKVLDGGVASDAVKSCSFCKVLCNSQIMLDIHMAGQEHAAMLKQQQQQQQQRASIGGQDKPLGEQPKEKSAHPTEDGLEAKRQKVLDHGVAADAVRTCSLCKIVCHSQTMLDIHVAGRKHAAMVKQQLEQTPVAIQDKALGEGSKEESACPVEEDLEARRPMVLDSLATLDAVSMCTLCNIVCSSKMFNIHLAGKKHVAMVKQQQQASVSGQNNDPGKRLKRKFAATGEEDLDAKRQRALDNGAAADVIRFCTLCKVICINDTVFHSHMAGRKHARNEKQKNRASVASQDKDECLQPKKKTAPQMEEEL